MIQYWGWEPLGPAQHGSPVLYYNLASKGDRTQLFCVFHVAEKRGMSVMGIFPRSPMT